MKTTSVLVTGVGAPGGVTIMKALRYSTLPIRLITSDLNPNSVGLFFSDAARLLPKVADPLYEKRLMALCREEKVDIAFIGAEPEIRYLLPHFQRIQRETGTVFVISRPEFMTACMDKWETVRLLRANGFQCPQTALASDGSSVRDLLHQFGFPLFIKPRFGSGSKNTFVVHSEAELAFLCQYVPDAIVQEYLAEENEEYTVGTYVNRNGKVVGSSVCRRDLASGLTYRAFFDSYPKIAQHCEQMAEVLRPLGPCNFQLRCHQGKLSVFEINPRCSSATIMRAVMGFNEPEMAIRDLIFHEDIARPETQRGVVLRFWEEAYVDCASAELNAVRFGDVAAPPAKIVRSLMVRHRS